MGDRPPLPVDDVLPEIVDLLGSHRTLVLEAPPGTGKTTRVPPALLASSWLDGNKVLMLEPRRVAARAAAERIASELGTRVGGRVGIRTRFDTRVGKETVLEVVTEGILTRMLITDPSLSGIGVVVFDEFHERSIHADTGLAFVRETAAALREDLRVVIMSATVDASDIATRLGAAAVVRVDAPIHPVETRYRPPAPGRSAEEEIPDAVKEALVESDGDILVFLAGAGDINRAARALRNQIPEDVVVTPLHGGLPAADQDRALKPDPRGRRKIILSTPIAETSVTIDGVRVVIDTGRRRRPEHDIGRGMSRLRTVNASRAATDQRRGRAGRQAPGTCIRLWPEIDQERRRADEPPEILTSDLTSLALQIAAWGATEAAEIPWLDPPPEAALAAGRGVLTSLRAIDDSRRLTSHGRSMADLGAEPRLAHLMLKGAEMGVAGTACDLAAVLSDRDLLTGRDRPTDLRARLIALDQGGSGVDPRRRGLARDAARRWRRRFSVEHEPSDPDAVGTLVSLAFPDRIAQRRAELGNFLLASGAGASMNSADSLAREKYIAIAETDGVGADARIVSAAPLDVDDLGHFHEDRIEHTTRGDWDRRARDAVFEHQQRLGALVLKREPDTKPDRDALNEALLAGVRREGIRMLKWTEADHRWRERLQFLHEHDPDTWPSFDDDTLLREVEDWLSPAITTATRRVDLEMVDIKAALNARLDWRLARDIDRLAPTHIEVPSGSRIPVDYAPESGPVLAVRLQELFGLSETPTIADGVPLVIHLLSPAHRPVQITRDLASFWIDGYPEIRRELRGRYPKHQWPQDPTTAQPTSRVKRRR